MSPTTMFLLGFTAAILGNGVGEILSIKYRYYKAKRKFEAAWKEGHSDGIQMVNRNKCAGGDTPRP